MNSYLKLIIRIQQKKNYFIFKLLEFVLFDPILNNATATKKKGSFLNESAIHIYFVLIHFKNFNSEN